MSGRDVTLSHLFLRSEVKIYLDEPPPLRLAVPVNIPISCRSHAIQSAGGGGFGLSRSFYMEKWEET